MNFWQMTNASRLSLLGMQFSNMWTFWLAYTIFSLPVLLITQYFFFWFYWYGYNVLFPSHAWHVQATTWASSILVTFLMVWLYFGELPTKNVVIALVCLVGAFVAIVFK